MPSSFLDMNALANYIIEEVKDVANNELSRMMEEEFKKSKQENFYDAYQPSTYQRTYEFLNSNLAMINDKRSSNKKLVVEVVTPFTLEYMPSRHPSWVDGSNQNKNIGDYAEYGNGGSSIFSYAGRPYKDSAEQHIKDKAERTMINGLKKRGINAK